MSTQWHEDQSVGAKAMIVNDKIRRNDENLVTKLRACGITSESVRSALGTGTVVLSDRLIAETLQVILDWLIEDSKIR